MKQSRTEGLREEVAKFKAWAAVAFPEDQHGEWETEYEEWDGLYNAATCVLRQDAAWTDEEINLLLYAVARDNETELLAGQVPNDRLLLFARAALISEERDAKWQLVIRLPQLSWNAEIEELLLLFAADESEYVRRRAMLALADCKSVHAERLAEAAWETGEQYQRIAALHALHKVNSGLLQGYLQLADKDGRQFVVKNAQDIRQQHGDKSVGYQDPPT